MHLLVVEDDQTTARILQMYASRTGHTCSVVPDGDTAWERLVNSTVFDVVLSGWYQPGLSGMELCQRVSAYEDRHIPFIFVTAVKDRHLQLEGMRAGAAGYLTKPINPHELEMQLLAAERTILLHRKLKRYATELELRSAHLYKQGRRDTLTGLANRRSFDEELAEVHRNARKAGEGYALAVIDVDHFKLYNDQLGHQAGDVALKHIADCLQRCTRATDRVFRYGGEEFAVIIRTPTPSIAFQVAERFRQQVQAEQIRHAGSPHDVVTISVGYAVYDPVGGESAAQLFHRADDALYVAKGQGRNQVCGAGAARQPAGVGG